LELHILIHSLLKPKELGVGVVDRRLLLHHNKRLYRDKINTLFIAAVENDPLGAQTIPQPYIETATLL
jgi:hypothetical protein